MPKRNILNWFWNRKSQTTLTLCLEMAKIPLNKMISLIRDVRLKENKYMHQGPEFQHKQPRITEFGWLRPNWSEKIHRERTSSVSSKRSRKITRNLAWGSQIFCRKKTGMMLIWDGATVIRWSHAYWCCSRTSVSFGTM